tara:strand:- start:3441 stop:3614 length:174 start_codon:yes stop_codon:yes gene_type:complete
MIGSHLVDIFIRLSRFQECMTEKHFNGLRYPDDPQAIRRKNFNPKKDLYWETISKRR